jgi:hypothetical protein
VYNKDRLFEKYLVTLRLYIGDNRYWSTTEYTLAPYNRTSHAYQMLEEHITHFLFKVRSKGLFDGENITSNASIEPTKTENQGLYFEYCVLVDQLLYYSGRLNSGETFFQLANLLFG